MALRTAVAGGRRRLAALACALASAAPAAAFESPEELPDGEGRDDTFYFCSACHSFTVVARQGMSRALWDDTLTWMSERHGMLELEGEERRLILDYLAATYPPKAASGWVNPFAPRN